MSNVTLVLENKHAVPAEHGKPALHLAPHVAIGLIFGCLIGLVPYIGGASKFLFAAALVPLVVWTAFTSTEAAIYVYLAWCWFDGAIRGAYNDNSVSILARDIVLLVIVGAWLMRRHGVKRWDPIVMPPLALGFALFAVDCVAQLANPFSLGLANNLAGLKVHLSALPIYFVAYDVFRDKAQIRNLAIFLTIISAIGSLVAWNQYSHGREWTYAHYPGASKAMLSDMQLTTSSGEFKLSDLDVVNFRPPGCTTGGGNTGLYDAMIAPLTFALLLAAGRQRRLTAAQRLLTSGVLLLFLLTIFTGGLRSALVNMLLGIAATAWICGGVLRFRALGALALCAVFGVLAWSISSNMSKGAMGLRWGSMFADPVKALHSDRQTFYDQIGNLSVESPLGVGLGREGAAAGHLGSSNISSLGFRPFSESYYGFLILELGIPGALIMAFIVFSVLARSIKAVNLLPMSDDRLFAAVLSAEMLVIAIECFAAPSLTQPPGSVIFWLYGGMAMRLYSSERALVALSSRMRLQGGAAAPLTGHVGAGQRLLRDPARLFPDAQPR